MQVDQLTVHRYRLATRLDVVSGDIHHELDQALLAPPSDDVTLPDLAEFELKVVVEGFPILAASTPNPRSPTDPAALQVRTRFDRLQAALEQELLAEVTRLARVHLGPQGWLVQRVAVEAGSLTIMAVLLAGGGLLMKYKALRDNVVLLHADLTQHAIPFARRVWNDLFTPMEVFPQRQVHVPAMPMPAVAKPAAADDVTSILREIRDELKALRQARAETHGAETSLADQMRRAQEAEAAARGDQGGGRGRALDLVDDPGGGDARPKI